MPIPKEGGAGARVHGLRARVEDEQGQGEVQVGGDAEEGAEDLRGEVGEYHCLCVCVWLVSKEEKERKEIGGYGRGEGKGKGEGGDNRKGDCLR